MSSPVLSHSFTDSSPPDLFGVRALKEHHNTFNLSHDVISNNVVF